mmetsp:Transcript_1110/g.3922  ORF Transcript_1110/g.3922 Transcript_1110/m.3922 type:complete len:220 (-) Transcript_1110:347-1006(-)
MEELGGGDGLRADRRGGDQTCPQGGHARGAWAEAADQGGAGHAEAGRKQRLPLRAGAVKWKPSYLKQCFFTLRKVRQGGGEGKWWAACPPHWMVQQLPGKVSFFLGRRLSKSIVAELMLLLWVSDLSLWTASIFRARSPKASSIPAPVLALTSTKPHPFSLARASPSSADTALPSSSSHLEPTTTTGVPSSAKTRNSLIHEDALSKDVRSATEYTTMHP